MLYSEKCATKRWSSHS